MELYLITVDCLIVSKMNPIRSKNKKPKKGNDSKTVIPLFNNMNPRVLEFTVCSGNNTLYINAWRTGTLREHLSDRTSFFPSDEDHGSKDLLA